MEVFLHWVDENIFWIIIFFVFFGSGIVGGAQAIVGAYGGRKIRNLKNQLASAQRERDTAQDLLKTVSTGRPMPELQFVEFAATSARMARLLGLVQGADTAWPQLADGLRDQIDAELRAYEQAVVPKALEGPKGKKGRKG
jgi:hypothetical protein